ncbi:MAG: DUF1272 domain-containing protein [Proteobacteria bacterium]|nr:DUF1272 domain-containing protein [Pseudomonadota bacterium]
MMLQLRPNCELCDKDLPANALDARICTYECTFCATCVADVLHNVCPNCGGGFSPRPIRPSKPRRAGVSLQDQPSSQTRVTTKFSAAEIAAFCAAARDIEPHLR